MPGKRIENCIYDLGEDRAKRYFVRVKLPTGKDATAAFANIRAARAFRDEKLSKRAQGISITPRSASVTYETFAEDWRKNRSGLQALSTSTKVEAYFRNHVYPTLGSKKIGAIRRSHIEALVATINRNVEPVTVKIIYSYVSAVFTAAVHDDIIAKSPCIDITLPKAQKATRVVPLDPEQVRYTAEAMVGALGHTVLFAAATGLRPGELFGLTVDRVDFLGKSIVIDRQLVTPQRGPMFLGPLKTRASYRTIPISTRTVELLAAHMAQYPPTDYDISIGAPAGDGPDERPIERARFLFALRGSPVRRARQSVEWRRATDGLVLPDRSGWHALRHFYASSLIAAGVNVKVIQERMGHGSAMETLDTYAHLFEQSEDETRAAIDASLRVILDEGDEGSAGVPAGV